MLQPAPKKGTNPITLVLGAIAALVLVALV